jgi:hypothetical protein
MIKVNKREPLIGRAIENVDNRINRRASVAVGKSPLSEG